MTDHPAKLSKPQAVRLLRFHATGDPGGGSWPTMLSLVNLGLVTDCDGHLSVSAYGQAWCLDNHMQYIF